MASRFIWRGNDLGLDLLNTEAVDRAGAPAEFLLDADALFEWASEAGLADEAMVSACRSLPHRSKARLLAWVRRLRSFTRSLVDPAVDQSAQTAAADAFAAIVGEIPVRLTVPRPPGPTPAPRPLPVTSSTPADLLRLTFALAAIETLGLDRDRIRRCEGERCVLLYYDTSRNRSRRWCDMDSCGNRAKAAAHYRRVRAAREG